MSVSLANMIERIGGLTGTSDLTDWENEFVESILNRYDSKTKVTNRVSSKQAEIIERIFNKHFAE